MVMGLPMIWTSVQNTPTGETVDADGCSDSQKDTDGDGVTDDLDIVQTLLEVKPSMIWDAR